MGQDMPVDINIEYDDRELVEALNRLARAGQDLTPAMREIAAALEDAAAEAFDSERAPSGEPWADLSERFIPAHAGNSPTRSAPSSRPPVHPRACGEQSSNGSQ